MAMEKDSIPFLLSALAITCAIGAAGLAVTFTVTKPVIDATTIREQNDTVRMVLPDFDGTITQKTVTGTDGSTKDFFIAHSSQNTVVGYATVTSAVGYGGPVVVMVGFLPDGTIYGVQLLRHQETPGLGAKAGTPSFEDQFKGKKLSSPDDMLHVIKTGPKTNDTITAITAATITSKAFTRAVNAAIHTFLKHRTELAQAG